MDLRYSEDEYGCTLYFYKNEEIYDRLHFLNKYEIDRHIKYIKSISNFPNEVTLKKIL